MPRVSTALLLVCWVVSAIPAQEIALRADCGGWKPGPELRARAAALKGLDAKVLVAAVEKLEAEGGKALRIRVCRAGLRLADAKAAFACATRLNWNEVDLWETERVIALCLEGNAYTRPGTLVDFEELRSMIGGKELPRIFASFPAGPWNDKPSYYLANLHRQCTAEHIPALSAMLVRPEPEVRRDAWENLHLVAVRTDRHRDCALRAMLTWKDIPIRTGPERALGADEWPPALCEIVLRRWPRESGMVDPVVRRAVLTLRPLPEDEPAIRQFIEPALAAGAGPAPLSTRQFLLIRALRHFDSTEATALLRRLAATDRLDPGQICSTQLIATAALAARGDPQARAALASRAATDDEALALWFEAEPRAAAAWYERCLLGGSDAAAEKALARWEDLAIARHELILDWPDDLFAGLAGRAAASPRSGLALLGIGITIPGCARESLAAAATARLQPREISVALARENGYREVVERFAFLEVAAGEAARTWLRARIGDSDRCARDFALPVLLQLGDPALGSSLTDWIKRCSGEEGWPDVVAEHPTDIDVLLGQTRCSEARRYLLDRARRAVAEPESGEEAPDSAIIGLAVADGLPPHTAAWVAGGEQETDQRAPWGARCRKLIADGRADRALVLALENLDLIPFDLWRLDRPEVRAFLERMRREREHGLYHEATAALACMGDPAARGETFAALQAGRYRWLDELSGEPAYATLGYDLTRMVPFWIDQLESNCCRNCVAENVLEDLFPHGYGLYNDSYDKRWETRATIARRWWRQHRRAKFVHSRLVDQFIPVLPD